MPGYRRKRILFDQLQHRLLVTNLIYFTTFGVCTGVVLFTPLLVELSGPPTLANEQERAADMLLHLAGLLVPAAIVLLALLTLHSVLISHRIAGPLYRFRKAFEAAEKNGDFSVVHIRQHDYLKREADSINKMFAATSSRCASVRERFAELQQVLSQTPEARETGKAVGVESKLEALRLAIGNLEPARGAAEGPSAETAKAVQDSVKVNA